MFCGNCVTKLPVYRMNYVDPAFVCKKCESTCTAEADFYEHHLKILCKGINKTWGAYDCCRWSGGQLQCATLGPPPLHVAGTIYGMNGPTSKTKLICNNEHLHTFVFRCQVQLIRLGRSGPGLRLLPEPRPLVRHNLFHNCYNLSVSSDILISEDHSLISMKSILKIRLITTTGIQKHCQ